MSLPADTSEAAASRPLLEVQDLTVEFATRRGIVRAVRNVNITVAKGETLGIVGESGSGKSVTSYAVMRILDRAGRIAQGSIAFSGLDLQTVPESEMREMRGREMSMIFQNPRAALNPIRKVGRQIEDVLLQHAQVDSEAVSERAIETLEQVRIARPRERYHAYPFELSGGMCQRVVIAVALACRPQLLIADEPTTGLDVTTQKAVMDLVVELTRERGMSTILITHDLGLAAAYCDRVMVMEKGHVVEDGGVAARTFAGARTTARGPDQICPKNIEFCRERCLARRRATGERVSSQGHSDFSRQNFQPQAAGGNRDFPRRGRHQLFHRSRRKRWARWRIRLRQIHHLDDGDAADRQNVRPHHVWR